MGKFEEAVRAEVIRLTRKELKQQLSPLVKTLRELKRGQSNVQKQLTQLQRQIPKLAESSAEPQQLEVSEEEVGKARISGKLIRLLRKRLKVTQNQLADLVGVSPSAVAQWEMGTTKPQGKNRASLVGLRKMSRRQVASMLENNQSINDTISSRE